MASIRKEAHIAASVDAAWALLRDVGHPDIAFAGVLTEARLAGDVRIVRFANGMEATERIVSVSEPDRRLAYTVMGEMFEQHAACMQIFAEDDGCRFVWISDFLPDSLAEQIAPLIDAGTDAFVRNAEARTAPSDKPGAKR